MWCAMPLERYSLIISRKGNSQMHQNWWGARTRFFIVCLIFRIFELVRSCRKMENPTNLWNYRQIRIKRYRTEPDQRQTNTWLWKIKWKCSWTCWHEGDGFFSNHLDRIDSYASTDIISYPIYAGKLSLKRSLVEKTKIPLCSFKKRTVYYLVNS